MTADVLEPRSELLSEEYVLVQAWKKSASHIRYHNWYSDTLELDRTAVNLPRFLSELAEQLKFPDQWSNDPLRIVPAPKSQQWRVAPETKFWEPVQKGKTAVKLRPLAHVSLKDQVAATAVMLCLANRVETIQGDPRDPITDAETRKRVVSYGNRLFCDKASGGLRHRWGSSKLYRAYYQDYRSFLSRPELAAEAVTPGNDSRVLIVHSDLRQFYDRVRPALVAQKLSRLTRPGDDSNFFALTSRVLDWTWNKKDSQEVATYAVQAELADFSNIALPQGLVASGFFANIVLLDFDEALKEAWAKQIAPGIRLEDYCRYVDDLRMVLTVDHAKSLADVEESIAGWLEDLLNRHADGLQPSVDKTRAAAFRGDERPLVRQSRKMARIQTGISGGFDAVGGEEILDAVQGLIRSQEHYSEQRTEVQGWSFSPIPDVRDATVARFAAARFRSTYRSLRPLLSDGEDIPGVGAKNAGEKASGPARGSRTRAELDDDTRAFALGLIQNWVEDPSNVRLLRIGLDLWPAADVLKGVLDLLRPFAQKGRRRKAPRRVAWYCLAEIFRAGATETGFVEDDECLPAEINITDYRSLLREEADRLATLPRSTLPWYLKQQVLLFLATSDAEQSPIMHGLSSAETKHYRELIRFLKGDGDGMTGVDFATLAILSRRAFRGQTTAIQLAGMGISARRLEQIAERDPSFALELLAARSDLSAAKLSPRIRDDLCLDRTVASEGWVSLAEVVLQRGPDSPLRNELTILRFASKFLATWSAAHLSNAITPSDILLKLPTGNDTASKVDELKIVISRVAPANSMYRPPPWCPIDETWRFHLGYLLRFILAARQDFTQVVRPVHWREKTPIYRAPESHWYQRLYGLFNGHSAFGDDWLPISDWTERLLSALLSWPGCRTSEMSSWVRAGIKDTSVNIDARIGELSEKQGPSSSVLMLPLTAPRVVMSGLRPLRACIVQTVIPTPSDFTIADLTISDPAIRKRHRNHLSAALAAIERMLDLRETHKGRDGRLDWLILPELSVHPRDIRTHLVPFARAHRAIILAGLTYEELFAGQPLVNSAIWIIPVWSATHGLQVLIRRQGKRHLAPSEDMLNAGGAVLQGFRPCQWLVGYEWSSCQDRPLWLTSSVCYDATDLRLAADLRRHSDVFAIVALNQDVSTFDQMALALHYHMFQMVIVANNGIYGGSNAYVPFKESFVRQVFHLHGQPQASVAFLEIDNIAEFITRQVDAMNAASPDTGATPSVRWKWPPAGL